MSKLRDFAPILIVICCAAVFGTLLMTGVIDLNSIPTLVEHRPVLAVCVVLLFFIIKGLSGVVVYNALVIVVSLIFPLPTALAINGVGTAICLSVSYWIAAAPRRRVWSRSSPSIRSCRNTSPPRGNTASSPASRST